MLPPSLLAPLRPVLFGFFLLCLLAGCARSPKPGVRLPVTIDDDLHLRTGSYDRHVLIHLPPHAIDNRPLPLVVVLHGAFSTGREMEEWTGWSELADREGFIVIYPEGIGILGFLQHWNAGHCCGKAADEGWDDAGFIEAAIAGVSRKYPVDPRRVYLMGFSNGGMMAYRFAAEHPGLVAAVAVVAGATGGKETPESPEWLLPVPQQPVPLLILHGTADESVPYAGGRPASGGTREYRSADDAFAFWARADRCVGEPLRTVAFAGAVTEESCNDAAGRYEVRLVRLADWGHEWPGGTFTRKLDGNHPLKGFDAATFIWRFLRRFPADGAGPLGTVLE